MCAPRTSTGASGSGPPAASSRAIRPGTYPPAVHQPIDGLYDERGAFADVAALRGVFSAVDPDSADELITYCTIGGRACTAWFVLTYLLGREGVRVYDGSWAEWGRMPGAPVEQA
jgi:thiosulfate/3-mercaptopyruvate sulfurtransferase